MELDVLSFPHVSSHCLSAQLRNPLTLNCCPPNNVEKRRLRVSQLLRYSASFLPTFNSLPHSPTKTEGQLCSLHRGERERRHPSSVLRRAEHCIPRARHTEVVAGRKHVSRSRDIMLVSEILLVLGLVILYSGTPSQRETNFTKPLTSTFS